MLKKNHENAAAFVDVLRGLSQVMRCCCRDESFCEGVTFHQFMILDAVAGHKELLMADLHKWLAVEKSTTTRLVNPLIAKRLLKREAVANDSRAARLVLTRQGEEKHQKVLACLTAFSQRALGGMPAVKRAGILKSVDMFISAIKTSSKECDGC